MNSLLDKNTRANLQARDLEWALHRLNESITYAGESIRWAQKGKFEDAYSECEDAEACCKVALDHLRELLP